MYYRILIGILFYINSLYTTSCQEARYCVSHNVVDPTLSAQLAHTSINERIARLPILKSDHVWIVFCRVPVK